MKLYERASLPPNLQEIRPQGSYTFPCSMYFADSDNISPGKPFMTKLHWHDAVELLHFEKGTFQVFNDMEHFTVCEEAYGFIESSRLHSIRCEDNYIEQAFLFEPSLLSFSSADAASQDVIEPLIQSSVAFPKLVLASSPAFSAIAEEFHRIREVFWCTNETTGDQYRVSSPAAQLRTRASVLNILAILMDRGLLKASVNSPNQRGEALKRVIRYINNNYQKSIYLEELAGIMNMNEQYFCRFFKKVTGKTPIAYINDIRIRHAALLLEKTDLPVTQVAMDCGCNNMGHFIAEFRKRTSHAPLEYRKKQKSTASDSSIMHT